MVEEQELLGWRERAAPSVAAEQILPDARRGKDKVRPCRARH